MATVRVQFQRLERSELARELAEERVGEVLREFPEHARSVFVVTLSSERSESSFTPDLFRARIVAEEPGPPVDVESAAPSLYAALSSLQQTLRERLRELSQPSERPSERLTRSGTGPRSRTASSSKA
jgi:ribosome-associated translation inhibitor RaiA